jgi:hypothetical protein
MSRYRNSATVFPEMDTAVEVREITEVCRDIFGKSPESAMRAIARRVVKLNGAARPAVLACTLFPYDECFELGPTLARDERCGAAQLFPCAKFCVLGAALAAAAEAPNIS